MSGCPRVQYLVHALLPYVDMVLSTYSPVRNQNSEKIEEKMRLAIRDRLMTLIRDECFRIAPSTPWIITTFSDVI